MSDPVEIVDQKGSFRLIRDRESGRHAIVEARDNKVYTVHPREREAEPDTPEGMARLVEPDGWQDPAEARAKFAEITREGEELAKEIW
ncbi:hypothetical protein C882_2516 [Caenispirillum salinarum AK4]|uniref:Uncharacterized protein n=1 Tax=Caenispirillum salinarum AK4 TaxID=1238182 RepID=K9H4D7_9PROT|nr:hypothetical protein [Caenispirillum salinarum]EKV32437.1 hypothetical protein C882_2516 [Caenispirillum salinarum AK4]